MNTIPTTQLQNARKRGQLALFLGPDLPEAVTGLPSRRELSGTLAAEYDLPAGLPLEETAERLGETGNRHFFTRHLMDALAGPPARPAGFHTRLAAFITANKLRTVLSAAYDSLLPRALGAAGRPFNRLVTSDDARFIQPGRVTLVQLYGTVEQPGSLVITSQDHYDLLERPDKTALVDETRRAFQQNTVLFLGYDLADPGFRFIFRQVGDSQFAHPAFAVWPGLDGPTKQLWQGRGITILDTDPFSLLDRETHPGGGLIIPKPGGKKTRRGSGKKEGGPVSKHAGQEKPGTTIHTGGGDFVGRDKITHNLGGGHFSGRDQYNILLSSGVQGLDNAVLREQWEKVTRPAAQPSPAETYADEWLAETIRLDVAAPKETFAGKTFHLAITVMQPDSTPVTFEDLDQMISAIGEIFRERSDHLVDYRIQVTGANCDIEPPQYKIRLRPGKNARPCFFQVTPHQAGDLQLVVNAYQEDETLAASTRLEIPVTLPVETQGRGGLQILLPKRQVYLSYAWGGEREEIVNRLDQAFQARGLTVIRDKRDLGFKGVISAFMSEIGTGGCVLVVISDKYLKSSNCMFELTEIADHGDFADRIFPIVLGDAKIYDAVDRLGYIQYWEEKIQKLEAAMRMGSLGNLQGITDDLNLYIKIRNSISRLVDILQDMNTLTPTMHEDGDFEIIFNLVMDRCGGG